MFSRSLAAARSQALNPFSQVSLGLPPEVARPAGPKRICSSACELCSLDLCKGTPPTHGSGVPPKASPLTPHLSLLDDSTNTAGSAGPLVRLQWQGGSSILACGCRWFGCGRRKPMQLIMNSASSCPSHRFTPTSTTRSRPHRSRMEVLCEFRTGPSPHPVGESEFFFSSKSYCLDSSARG